MLPNRRAYLIGSGIAALATAAYLLRDGAFAGDAIHIFDEMDELGGSLDGNGTPATGYRLRGGRMLNYSYVCTYDLLSFIPSLTDPDVTVRDEIRSFNAAFPTLAKARLIEDGSPIDVSSMGFSARDRIDLIEMALRTESSLGTSRIESCFHESFFATNFWFMWATTFSFEPWHSAVEFKRYLHRFIQEFSRISTLAGVDRTPFNQYDSIVRPLVAWLERAGVHFHPNAQVLELGLAPSKSLITVESLRYSTAGSETNVPVRPDDYVFATLGSMTAASTWGTMTSAPPHHNKDVGGSWTLWESLAKAHTVLGRPDVFDGRIDQSGWVSFTMTFTDTAFFDRLQAFAGNALATFKDSNWLMSIVLAHQPHFIEQPAGVRVAWGYGLFTNREGNFVNTKMSEATGEEIMTELLGHLQFDVDTREVLDACICLPCLMPFITSQFLTRASGDRPNVIPKGSTNLALIGQYCEIPDDTVFTVEYSVRSAQIAVYGLLRLDKVPTPMYDGLRDPDVLAASIQTLLT